MKRIILAFLCCFPLLLSAQPKFDLGIKGGVNFSKLSLNADDYSPDAVTKTHLGVFGRIGWNRIFIQPELYFSGKGGDVTSDISGTITSFDVSTLDVPVLAGFSIIKAKIFHLHLLAGPVFSSIRKSDITGGNIYNETYLTDKYMAIQYGLGVDVLFLNFNARMENGLGSMYKNNTDDFKNNTFMLSVGFKFL